MLAPTCGRQRQLEAVITSEGSDLFGIRLVNQSNLSNEPFIECWWTARWGFKLCGWYCGDGRWSCCAGCSGGCSGGGRGDPHVPSRAVSSPRGMNKGTSATQSRKTQSAPQHAGIVWNNLRQLLVLLNLFLVLSVSLLAWSDKSLVHPSLLSVCFQFDFFHCFASFVGSFLAVWGLSQTCSVICWFWCPFSCSILALIWQIPFWQSLLFLCRLDWSYDSSLTRSAQIQLEFLSGMSKFNTNSYIFPHQTYIGWQEPNLISRPHCIESPQLKWVTDDKNFLDIISLFIIQD